MVEYYENEAAVIAALKRAKTPQEVIKIAQDLEQRMYARSSRTWSSAWPLGTGRIRLWRYCVK